MFRLSAVCPCTVGSAVQETQIQAAPGALQLPFPNPSSSWRLPTSLPQIQAAPGALQVLFGLLTGTEHQYTSRGSTPSSQELHNILPLASSQIR